MEVHLSDPQALDRLREALVRFRTELTTAISEADSDVRRLRDWLEKDRIPGMHKLTPKLREQLVLAMLIEQAEFTLPRIHEVIGYLDRQHASLEVGP